MSAVLLPTSGYYVPTPSLIGSASQLAPALGGPVQRIARVGGRWRFEVRVAAQSGAAALAWTVLAEEDAVFALRLPQPGIVLGTPGTPRVAGGSQTGNTLGIDGLAASYPLQLGQWLSIVIDGQRYLYRSTANVAASGGALTAFLNPALRVSPNDNDVVEIDAPTVEGFVTLSRGALQFDGGGTMRPFTFTLEERR